MLRLLYIIKQKPVNQKGLNYGVRAHNHNSLCIGYIKNIHQIRQARKYRVWRSDTSRYILLTVYKMRSCHQKTVTCMTKTAKYIHKLSVSPACHKICFIKAGPDRKLRGDKSFQCTLPGFQLCAYEPNHIIMEVL